MDENTREAPQNRAAHAHVHATVDGISRARSLLTRDSAQTCRTATRKAFAPVGTFQTDSEREQEETCSRTST